MPRALQLAARLVLGLVFTAVSLGYFLVRVEPPPAHAAVMHVLSATHLLPVAKAFELAAGLALLRGRFVPLAVTILAPIEVAVLATNLALGDAGGVGLALVLMLCTAGLAWAHRQAFAPLLRARP